MGDINIVQAQIASGQALSGQVDIGERSLVGLVLPTNWSAATGGISFQASPDGGATWYEVLAVTGSAYSIGFTAAGSAYIAIDPTALRGIVSIKVRSGTSAAPVNQTNTVTLQLITRALR